MVSPLNVDWRTIISNNLISSDVNGVVVEGASVGTEAPLLTMFFKLIITVLKILIKPKCIYLMLMC